jgi:serine/threonine protein kinase
MKVLMGTPYLSRGILALEQLSALTNRPPSGAIAHVAPYDHTPTGGYIAGNDAQFFIMKYSFPGENMTRALKAFRGRKGFEPVSSFERVSSILRARPIPWLMQAKMLYREAIKLRWLSHGRVIQSLGVFHRRFSWRSEDYSLILPFEEKGNIRAFLKAYPDHPKNPLVSDPITSAYSQADYISSQIADVATAVKYLFSVQILHCDLKGVRFPPPYAPGQG